MQIIDYIDFFGIYHKIKENHLSLYPTAEDYIKECMYYGEPYEYITEMYRMFNDLPKDAESCNSNNAFDNEVLFPLEDKLEIEFSIGGNNATENGDDYWGYGWRFTIDLDNELFTGYSYENYS